MERGQKMNERNPRGAFMREPNYFEWTTMQRDGQGDKIDMTASVPCHGCLSGYGCYNEEQCSTFYGAFHPSQVYGQQPGMPYSHGHGAGGQPNIPPAYYGHIQPVNQGYYDAPPPPHQQQFAGYHPNLPHPQPYYYGRPNAYVSPYYHMSSMKGSYNQGRHQGPPRHKSRGFRSGYSSAGSYGHEEPYSPNDMGSDSSSLTLSGNLSEDVRRAVSFVNQNRNATLFSIEGFIAEVALADDDITRRFIQERLKFGSENEQRLGLKAAISSFQILAKDERGSGLLQDLFTFGTGEMRAELLAALYDEGILDLSTNIHGCRVVQKAIRSIDQTDLSKLLGEFRGHVITLIHDSHGNHVIQRCIQAQSVFAKDAESKGDMDTASEITDQLQFIIDDVITHIESLSLHRYGCRVVQRSIEFCVEKQRTAVLEAITVCNENIVEDLYGNYVVQQAIVTGSDIHREDILQTLTRKEGNIFRLSTQKYASNVIEKMLQHGTVEQRELLLKEMLKVHVRTGLCCAIVMAQDPIANYVVKKAIECAPEGEQKQKLLQVISCNRDELLKSPYAKYIVRGP